ncbi:MULTISPECIES: hypothetical protein [Nocardioides]|uniref:Uncharacterized protein n=1 Tax=Nocardioides vastitatis TaxID=2568655 RepID=A0ABW0ZN36_9ACTN|nr:hypothetical protein [Nocardioides sp.]THJ08435.1 hypothetical protein E7Z54_04400 [Nocardioides sp.]
MDLSALIFVAVAVAWAVYLIPKALKHHEEDAVSRSVDGFSDRMRVLARREPLSATEATLVPAERTAPVADAEPEIEETPAASTPAPRPSRSSGTAARAAARRRRVFNILLLAIAAVAGLAIGAVIAPIWVAAPVALMAAWLVACRLMVKRERAARAAATPVRKRRRTLAEEEIAAEDGAHLDDGRDNTEEIPVVAAELLDESRAAPVDPDAWTPVPVPLPTYVAKAPAGRSVRTIDLDSTGVWSSGRNEADSQLAREAEAQRAKPEAPDAEQRRAAGS